LAFADISFLIISSIVAISAFSKAFYEEELLEARFKEQYRQYKRGTPMFVPKFW